MRGIAAGAGAIGVVALMVVALAGCTSTSSEPAAVCISTTSPNYNATELADRLDSIGAHERPGYVSLSGSASRVDVYWFGPIPEDVAHEVANARACGAKVTVRPAQHSLAELNALRHRITSTDRAAWQRYGITVLDTSNRDDGSGVQVVVPDSVDVAEAQSFASSRYTVPVLVLSETDAGL